MSPPHVVPAGPLPADGDLDGVTSAWGRRLLRRCRPLCATTASRRAVLRERQSSYACRHTCWLPRALSLAARLADALLIEVVVVKRKVSMIVLLLVSQRTLGGKFRYLLKKFNRLLEAEPSLGK